MSGILASQRCYFIVLPDIIQSYMVQMKIQGALTLRKIMIVMTKLKNSMLGPQMGTSFEVI